MNAVVESIKSSCVPDTIHHGDLGTYNVRITDEGCIFYDWGCGGVSHSFFDTFRLLYSIRAKLPTHVPATDIIINAYLKEWSDYGSHDQLKSLFAAIDGLAGFYMAYVKYIRARNAHIAFAKNPGAAPMDESLDRRYETAAIYLREFIEHSF